MNSLVLQSLIPFLVITCFFSINLPFTLCADDPQYAYCSQAINCGNIPNISYPFWGVNRPNYCGQPGFEIECQGNVPMINMRNINFRILEMNSSSTDRAVKVARNDYWKTICPISYVNTSIDFSLFNYGSGLQNMSFYYGCNTTSNPTGLNVSLVCNSSVTVSYLTQSQTSGLPFSPVSTGACESEVLVPVSETAVLALDNNQTTIQEAIDGGFVLGLKIDNSACNNCEASGGKCGMNTTDGDFMCFCQDQPYAATTCGSRKTGTSSPSPGFVTGNTCKFL
ncbi:LEAF RUST 10 DISEASE-RESISTANCE LOCUS RECEPTOR-LIKE PROTEIN KINASE-like 2.1 [Rosa rugosa]|uniref:LEAF RUST 10 DISEASE-RESISTANCE LOCUS RECEPTOR-LIKE PROTEIN KINASE-like 2.1 n=1 Tax=Rosa rugosa TaxID=74645 RepID=UPI002B413559|nr:LEAF RUST 10 DISEASE-RESISTANCE LOCUS RECEPTOR-LIKE PROTEIN KINASE-like 2.1 [Rosa rugosa]